jgi:hypothetical protein
MNRYSQYNVAQYDPLSMQEIIAAPLYKQKVYDALEEARVKQAEMFKVNPLDVHTERAKKLNDEYMSKVDALANYQTKTGDIQGSKSKFLDLQREYKKLNDPMGEVSKINNAYVAEAAEKTRFLEAASKQYGSTQALNLWNQHRKNYTGVNDKNEIVNIDPKGIVANQDFMKDVKEFHDLMGKTTSSIAGSGYQIIERPEGLVMVNSSGKTVTNNNFEQLKNAEKALNSKWIQPTGEGTLFNIEAGKNAEEFKNYFTNTMYSQRESGVTKDSNTSATFIGNKTNNTLDGENVPLPEITVQNKNKNLLEKLTLGNSSSGSPKYLDLNTGRNGNSTNVWTKNSDIIQDPDYKAIAYGLNRKNGKNFKPGSIEERKAVVEYLTNNTGVGIQNARIDPNVSVSGNLFANKSIPKDKTKASENLTDKLKRNELLAVTENGEKIEAEDMESFTYTGDLTAESTITAFSAYDSRSNKLAHTGYITKKDGDKVVHVPVYVSRSINDFDKSEYKGGVDFYNIANTVKNRPGIYAQFRDDLISGNQGKNIKDFEVKYNSTKKTYDINYYDVSNKKTVSINNMDENKFQEALIISNNR